MAMVTKEQLGGGSVPSSNEDGCRVISTIGATQHLSYEVQNLGRDFKETRVRRWCFGDISWYFMTVSGLVLQMFPQSGFVDTERVCFTRLPAA